MNYRRYTIKGDFYWDEDSESWTPSEFIRTSTWQIEILREWIKPDKDGVSEFVSMDELAKAYPEKKSLITGNGSDVFSRGILSKNFIFNIPDSMLIDSRFGKVTHRRSVGLVENLHFNKDIRPEIRKIIRSQPCALTGTTNRIEVDHREGRDRDREQYRYANQRVEDFQPLSSVANQIKRECCAKCTKSGKRFDAKSIGYAKGWYAGGEKWKGTCDGCFWYDIIRFRSSLK